MIAIVELDTRLDDIMEAKSQLEGLYSKFLCFIRSALSG